MNNEHQNTRHRRDHDKLARDIHRILRAQPDRAAPASLENRVFAEIARRAALPWHKQSFARWPLAARAMFLLVTAAIAAAMIIGLARLLNIVPGQVETLSTNSLVMTARGYWNMAAGYCAHHLAGIPPHAWALVSAGIAACYATLFGFGAAAYRYLWKTQ